MAEFGTFYYGLIFFLMCCIVGLVMSYAGGMVIDKLYEEGKTMPGHDSDFAEASQGQIFWFINLYYFIMYLIPVIGAVVFGQSILKRVRTSRYTWR